MVIDTMQSPVQGKHLRDWSDVVIEKRRLAAERVADAVTQATRVDREPITTLKQAIKEHTCSSTAAWCSPCNHFHVSPHGLPLLCAALRRELVPMSGAGGSPLITAIGAWTGLAPGAVVLLLGILLLGGLLLMWRR